MTDLLPGPFCGGEAELTGFNAPEYWVWCPNCKASADAHTGKENAIAAWNTRTPIEYEGWFYLPKPKESIVDYGEPSITKTDNGYKVRQFVDVVDEATRKWGDELGEYVMRRICETWNTRSAGTCEVVEYDEAPFPVCSECGAIQPDDFTVYYCWNCGRKVTA